MTTSAITVLAVVGALSVAGAALLHAIVAAFEHLPYVAERELSQRLRPDGRPTSAARLARAPEHTDNAASVAYAILEAVALVSWSFLAWNLGVTLEWQWWAAALFAVVVAAFVALMVIRAIPRQLGRDHPAGTVRLVAPFAVLMIVLTTPVRAVVPALRIPALSEAEDIVEQAQDALEDEDAELLRSVVNLGDTLTREVMVPRTDMVTISSGTSMRKAMLLFMRSGFSRVPVIGDGVDDTVGVIYLKDVVKATWDTPDKLDEAVDTLMREPVFVPESVPADDLLRRMQGSVFHMAIVVDEYGGVAGLVTIEDALEEIVGEVVDEHDAEQPEIEPLPGGGYRVPARFPLDELGELFELDIDDDDVETVLGLLTKALGRVPIPGSRASSHGLSILAERAEGRRRRITTIVVSQEEVDADD
ncbi:MAG: HlyC/CorC family transporter [Actinobacteria bacterium HGW-Actinobacteria-4]|nr:MAG: HlyC/CorC family transporter [Actinobacteria bacterium HGW-Actinobacteria-4]